MRRTRKTLIVITSTVVLSNVFPITGVFQFFLDQRHYRYSSYNGSLTFTEYWSRGFQMMKNWHRS